MDQYLKDFLVHLRCPVTGSSLQIMKLEEITQLNTAIQAGSKFTREGKLIDQRLKEGFINEDASLVYPVLDEHIAVLLPDRAIPLKEQSVAAATLKVDGKKIVREFYDEYGWQKSEDNSYKDTVTFEDRRPVSQKYWSRCHMRLNKYLKGGDYLLDVASGAIPNDEYLTYSELYRLRICMDFSILAVKEAAVRLGRKGIFILGDMTNMPIADDCIDALISMHTVYHIPVEEQPKAIAEAYRVLKPEGEAVIVYSWQKPPLMRLAFKIWNPVLGLYKRIKRKNKPLAATNTPVAGSANTRPDLFVQQQNYPWFEKHIKRQYPTKLTVYSAISRSFSHTFLKEKMFGSQVSSFIFWIENTFPRFMGRIGQYPVFLITKKQKEHKGSEYRKNRNSARAYEISVT